MNKHAQDNRSNQLNPNNPAYSSSRGGDGGAREHGATVEKQPPATETAPSVAAPVKK